jgi:hypothetical protein
MYNCCSPSPAHSFAGPSFVGLATIFYSLRFESSLFVASYDSLRWRYTTTPPQGYCVCRFRIRVRVSLLYDWRFTANQFFSAPSPFRLTARFFLPLKICRHRPYVTSSLTRGWVCRLQVLLGLASWFILRSESHRTHDYILLSQIRDSPKTGAQVPVFIYPSNKVAQL